jgi:RNA polymerase sigma-70 factor (sigma-E family)
MVIETPRDDSRERLRGEEIATSAEPPTGRLAELFLQHADSAGRLAYLLTGDRELANDLVQDAFVKLARRFVHLRDPNAFEGYLRTTIVNLVRSHFRHRMVERAYLAKQPPPRFDHRVDSGIEEADALGTALLGLPDRQRTAVVLRFYEDLSVERTAEIMRCRPGTVKSLVFKGLGTLREVIGDE